MPPEQAAAELERLVNKAVMPTKLGIAPAHGVVLFGVRESPLSINEVIVAVRMADILALAAQLMQQSVVQMLERVPWTPLPKVPVPHKLFQFVEGGKPT